LYLICTTQSLVTFFSLFVVLSLVCRSPFFFLHSIHTFISSSFISRRPRDHFALNPHPTRGCKLAMSHAPTSPPGAAIHESHKVSLPFSQFYFLY
jgi:hypothetical protein